MITEYDPNWGNVIDLDGVIDDVQDVVSEIKSCFKSAQQQILNVQDKVNNFICTEENKLSLSKAIINLNNAKTCFGTLKGLTQYEIQQFNEKIDAVIESCENCLINCSVANARRSISNDTDCEINEKINELIDGLQEKVQQKENQNLTVLERPKRKPTPIQFHFFCFT